jgi:hypothetical protein
MREGGGGLITEWVVPWTAVVRHQFLSKRDGRHLKTSTLHAHLSSKPMEAVHFALPLYIITS